MSIHHWARGFGFKLRFIDGATRLRGMARSLDVAQVLTSIKKVELKIEDGVVLQPACCLQVHPHVKDCTGVYCGLLQGGVLHKTCAYMAYIYACRIP